MAEWNVIMLIEYEPAQYMAEDAETWLAQANSQFDLPSLISSSLIVVI